MVGENEWLSSRTLFPGSPGSKCVLPPPPAFAAFAMQSLAIGWLRLVNEAGFSFVS